jgi:hypothetical protein
VDTAVERSGTNSDSHQQPDVNYLPRFSPLLICLERSPLRGDRSREIDENLDKVHIRLLVESWPDSGHDFSILGVKVNNIFKLFSSRLITE